ncbi:MAG: hypothetical protein IPH20_19605 [Bacteroidales bacterium]|nr:hypothetical protein [Bacteroidales bacterium]
MFRTILDLRYYSKSNAFGFTSEVIQDIIINNIAISEIAKFSVQDAETYELLPSDHLLENATSILGIVREEDNNLYWGYSIDLKDGIKIKTDLNFTNITAPSRELLFEYCAFIFTRCGQDPEECLNLITKNPDQEISLTEIIETEDPECPF